MWGVSERQAVSQSKPEERVGAEGTVGVSKGDRVPLLKSAVDSGLKEIEAACWDRFCNVMNIHFVLVDSVAVAIIGDHANGQE